MIKGVLELIKSNLQPKIMKGKEKGSIVGGGNLNHDIGSAL